jgi:hypothetical protein
VLALALGGMTVAELQKRMSRLEFERWVTFHEMDKLDDRHRIFRPFALLAALQAGDGDVARRMHWLCPEPENEGLSEVDLSMMRAMGYMKKGG